MLALSHPEVLSIDWLPPTLPVRTSAVDLVRRALDAPFPPGRARLLAVEGPQGAGTSVVGRRAARTWMERTYGGSPGVDWRVLTVRVRPATGTTSVTGALLRHFDPGFEPRGFPAMEILAGCLRRLKREGKPSMIVLDDLDAGAPPLGDVVRGLSCPLRFLPEGDDGRSPPLAVILAGRPEAIDRIRRSTGLSIPRVVLAPYDFRELVRIVDERIARALGREAPAGMAERIARRAHEEGRGAARAMDLLRRELIGWSAARPGSVYRPMGTDSRFLIEDHLVRALERACQSGEPTLGELRSWERKLAEESGVTSLPPTTLWRRIGSLERAGYLSREVRRGGIGGTQSRLRMLRPVEEWITALRRKETPRAWVVPGAAQSGPAVPAAGPRPIRAAALFATAPGPG